MRPKRMELMQRIQRYDFALYDLMLYLDTHPECREARALFTRYRKERADVVREYVQHFGPIKALQTDTDKRWSWGEGPYPWEKEAN